jgi:hypothetical protein
MKNKENKSYKTNLEKKALKKENKRRDLIRKQKNGWFDN